MSLDPMNDYYAGCLSEAAAAMMMQAMAAQSQANTILRCAKNATMSGAVHESLIADLARLEKAVAALKEASALAKPAPYLVAAE